MTETDIETRVTASLGNLIQTRQDTTISAINLAETSLLVSNTIVLADLTIEQSTDLTTQVNVIRDITKELVDAPDDILTEVTREIYRESDSGGKTQELYTEEFIQTYKASMETTNKVRIQNIQSVSLKIENSLFDPCMISERFPDEVEKFKEFTNREGDPTPDQLQETFDILQVVQPVIDECDPEAVSLKQSVEGDLYVSVVTDVFVSVHKEVVGDDILDEPESDEEEEEEPDEEESRLGQIIAIVMIVFLLLII